MVKFTYTETCFPTVFPRILGGTQATTYFMTMDIDSSGNIAAGGGSNDGDLVSSTASDQPILLYIESGGNYLWSKQFVISNDFETIQALKFTTSATNIVVAFDNTNSYNQLLVILFSSDGSLSAQYDMGASYSILQDGLLIDSSDNIYIASTQNSQWSLMKFAFGSTSSTFAYYQSSSSAAYSITADSSFSQVYVSGYLTYSSVKYQTLSSYTSSGTQNFIYGKNANTLLVPMTRLSYYSEDNGYVYSCGTPSTESSTYFYKFTLSAYGQVSSVLYSIIDLYTVCMQIYAESSTTAYSLLFNSDSSPYDVILTKITMDSSNSYYYQYKFGGIYSYYANYFNYAVFESSTVGYFAGMANRLYASTTKTFTQTVGVVTSIDPDSCSDCLSFTISYTYSAFGDYGTDSFSSISVALTSQTKTITSSSSISISNLLSMTAEDPSWCPNIQTTITVPQLYDQYYDKNSGNGTTSYTFPSFTQSKSYCSGATFHYSAIDSVSGNSLASTITLTSSSRQFTWSSSTPTTSYLITLTGTLNNGQVATGTFYLYITQCSTSSLSASSTDQTYYVGQSSLSYTPTFTRSQTGCIVVYSMTNSDGSSYDASIFGFSTTTGTMTASTTASTAALVTKTLKVTGYLSLESQISASTTFNVNIYNCQYSSMTTTTISDQTYTIGEDALSFSFDSWSQSLSDCGYIYYYAKNYTNGATYDLDSDLISFDNSTRTFTVSSSDTSFASYSPMLVKVWGQPANAYSTTTYVQFYLTIVDPCTSASISATSLSDKTYSIYQPTTKYIFTEFSSSVDSSICGSFNYIAADSSGNSLNSIFTFTSSTRTISVKSDDTSSISISPYTIMVKGYQGTYTTNIAYFTFTVTVQIDCKYATISATPFNDYYYDISSGTNDTVIDYSTWTNNIYPTCTNIYTVYMSNNSFNNDSNYNTPFTFSTTDQKVYLKTSSSSYVGSYIIFVKIDVSSSATYQYVTVNITDNCPSSKIYYPSTALSTSYITSQATQYYQFSTFTLQYSYCSSDGISYTATYANGTDVNLTALTLFSSNRTFVIYTSDRTTAGTYSITLTGTYTPSGATNTTTFYLTILDECTDGLTLESYSLSYVNYLIGSGEYSFTIDEWTLSSSSCGDLTYSASWTNGWNNGYLTFDSSTRTFKIDTTDSSLSGTSKQIGVTGTIGTQSWTKYFTLNFCGKVTYVKPSVLDTTNGTLGDQYYEIGQSMLTVQFRSFNYSYVTCLFEDVQYELSVADFGFVPSFLSYDFTSNSTYKYLYIFTNDATFVYNSTYTITVMGYITNLDGTVVKGYLNVPLYIYANTAPPYFSPSLTNITVWLGYYYNISLPALIDNDIGDTGSITQIKYSGAHQFCRLVSSSYFIIAAFEEKHIGTYGIQIKVKDDNEHSLSARYSFHLEVKSNITKQNSTNTTQNVTEEDDLLKGRFGYLFNNWFALHHREMIIRNSSNYSDTLQASVDSIDDEGNLVVSFNNDIIVPDNYSFFNESVMYFFTLAGDYQQGRSDRVLEMENLTNNDISIQNWEMTSLTSRNMTFKVNFKQPDKVSLFGTDYIQILFLMNGYFIEKSSGKPIEFIHLSPVISMPEQTINKSSFFIYMWITVGFIALTLLLKLLSLKSRWQPIINLDLYSFKCLYKLSARGVFFNMIFRLFIEGYFLFALSSLINIQNYIMDTQSDQFASIFSIVLLFGLVIFPPIIWSLLWVAPNKLDNKDLRNTYGSLYKDLKTKRSPVLFHVFFTLRRMIYAILIVYIQDYQAFQLQLMTIMSFILIFYTLHTKPFQDTFLNRLEVFNEICILGIVYHLFSYSDMQYNRLLKYYAGWSIIAIVSINIALNMLLVIWVNIRRIFLVLRKIYRLIRYWIWMNHLRRVIPIDAPDYRKYMRDNTDKAPVMLNPVDIDKIRNDFERDPPADLLNVQSVNDNTNLPALNTLEKTEALSKPPDHLNNNTLPAISFKVNQVPFSVDDDLIQKDKKYQSQYMIGQDSEKLKIKKHQNRLKKMKEKNEKDKNVMNSIDREKESRKNSLLSKLPNIEQTKVSYQQLNTRLDSSQKMEDFNNMNSFIDQETDVRLMGLHDNSSFNKNVMNTTAEMKAKLQEVKYDDNSNANKQLNNLNQDLDLNKNSSDEKQPNINDLNSYHQLPEEDISNREEGFNKSFYGRNQVNVTKENQDEEEKGRNQDGSLDDEENSATIENMGRRRGGKKKEPEFITISNKPKKLDKMPKFFKNQAYLNYLKNNN